MTRETAFRALLALGSLVIGLAALEAVGRWLVEPSPRSSGLFLGRELPPVQILSPAPLPDPAAWEPGVIVNGQQITSGDLNGILRQDPILGYTYDENRVSANGWWQSNELGARSRRPTERAVGAGSTRLLIFGDSFAHGSRVAQEETIAHFLEARDSSLEVVNFAVDGYGMAQAYLRYQSLRGRLAYDAALMVFVPKADLIRDVNTLRSLIGWTASTIMPRYVIAGSRLTLVRSPYETGTDIYEDNADGLTDRVRRHLELYDRFYFPLRHRRLPVLDRLLLSRLFVLALTQERARRVHRAQLEPGSEATQVSREIFRQMAREVAADGGRFFLVLLPAAVEAEIWAGKPAVRKRWKSWLDYFCTDEPPCLDIAAELARLDPSRFDRGYDGTHFGPRSNEAIADSLYRLLQARDAAPAPAGRGPTSPVTGNPPPG